MRKQSKPAPTKGPAHCFLCGSDFESLDRLMAHLLRSCPGRPKVQK